MAAAQLYFTKKGNK